ncbi:MAG: MipA/OmpV family protein [Pseudomonadota bacterium]
MQNARLRLPATLALLAIGTTLSHANERLFSNVSLGVGGFALIAPSYEGSDEYRLRGIPVAFPIFDRDTSERSRVTFRGVDDVRLSVFRRDGFDVGPIVGYSFGRKESLSSKLGGLGDVDGGVVVGAFGSYTLDGLFADVGVSTQVTGGSDNGYLAVAGFGYTAEVAPRVSLTGRADLEYASEGYMDRYFSVTPDQAQASTEGYTAFDASGGIKNMSAGLSVRVEATDRLSLLSNAGYSRLLGNAADSPISVSDNQVSGGLGLLFSF